MAPMSIVISPARRSLLWAFVISLAIHLLLLLAPQHAPPAHPAASARLEARFAPVSPAPAENSEAAAAQPPAAASKTPRTRRLTAQRPTPTTQPTWTVAEKAEMNDFLDELARQPGAVAKPTLAQRSQVMAREQGRQMAARDKEGESLLELRPNAQPPDPFSLELYLDGLVQRLNRSSLQVANDRRGQGVRPAAIHFRLNPDGSLKSFVVLNAGDQTDEIAYIKAVVERSVPFLPFPPDIDKAARSLGITICIRPANRDGSAGFSRMSGGRCH
ncbi:MAG: hypothetical protein CVU34_16400 [Betaproteobacteria bacterium HGW-Betaproteobacteria-7]|jgi:hypothetical protein|nr:MAG: hypothetical protein CVU34_16400 [Betaproteobacteria bacterium HGW-Betaproteobacteria-7]